MPLDRQRRRGTFALSWGPSGGFYVERGYCPRLCLGRLAITRLPIEVDDLMEAYVERDDLAKTVRRAYRQLSNTEVHRNSQWVNAALDTLRGKAGR